VQEITPILQGGNMVFAYAEPVSASLPAVVELSADIHGGQRYPDVVAVRSRTSLAQGRPYRVISYVPAIDKTSLRLAGQSYPAEIRDRYLQLPSGVPQRVYDLAAQVVADRLQSTIPPTLTGDLTLASTLPGVGSVVVHVESGRIVGISSAGELGKASVEPSAGLVQAGLVTPYDAAEAIEEYLRTQLNYRDDVAAPPPTVDVVDYFLFESKTGYCDYFASAMVVLMRTQGVPARLIRGYAGGVYDQDRGAYVVAARLAHSWVEVYFPVYGWQRFEPTAADYTSRPRRAERPSSPSAPARTTPITDEELDDLRPPRDDEGLDPGAGLDVGPGRGFPRAALWVPGVFLVVGAVGVGILALRVNRGLWRFSLPAATYERMCRWAGMVDVVPAGERTPYEISGHMVELLSQRRTEISQIAAAYVRERFSLHPLAPEELPAVRQSWARLRWVLWTVPLQRARARFLQLWHKVQRLWEKIGSQSAAEVEQ
jgi:hypothetical protein